MNRAYPLETRWQRLRGEIADRPPCRPTGLHRECYLDLAERIVRTAAGWQDDRGIIVDPYYGQEAVSGTARFVGALGHLLRAGRCLDLRENCIQGYEACLRQIEGVRSPEDFHKNGKVFWIKELMYAHEALKDNLERSRLERWNTVWAQQPSRYEFHHNILVFAAAGEFFKQRPGLSTDVEYIDQCIAGLRPDFTEFGMYRDPSDPMTYDLVVKQQLDLIRHYGYQGVHRETIREICRRGALTSLLGQSVTGQMPFGGRSNQFHFVEAHFICLCETQARAYQTAGDRLMAGIFKRAARRAAAMIRPWIMEREPFRHTKQGFHPVLQQGIDSGGYYSVYGLLAASLLSTAYHIADEFVAEVTTPAEIGGFVLHLWPAFHKVFATCGGYHIEIDTQADHHKDATGLGRLHREGIWPETALSGSISAAVAFDVETLAPAKRHLAIGPEWTSPHGQSWRLADMEKEISQVSLQVIREETIEVAFGVIYEGHFPDCQKIVETYRLSSAGLIYHVTSDNPQLPMRLCVPLITTDGLAPSRITANEYGFCIQYRNGLYRAMASSPTKVGISDDPRAANRNALYLTGWLETNTVKLELAPRT